MIVVLGSINRDIVVEALRLPGPGETVLGAAQNEYPGGKGANQAVATTRLGAETVFLGSVGNDAAGRWLVRGLEDEGVDTSHIKVDEERPSGLALVSVGDDGQNTIIVVPGANTGITADDVGRWRNVIASADVFLLQLEIPVAAVAAAADAAGGRVILNATPAHVLDDSLLSSIDVLVANEGEAAAYHGGVPVMITTLGPRGAHVADGTGQRVVPGAEVRAVDTTGAGDAFCGALAVALDRGATLDEAVREAVHAGALATTAVGARSAIPTSEALYAFMAEAADE